MGRDYLTIVSGLPRSGTSMMMQMLHAAGLPLLTDRLRHADEDNPNGYYEFEEVKNLKQDASWIPSSIGKAVKMVHLLLLDLPLAFQYRVIFMRRDHREVFRSQNRMLERLQGHVDDLPEERTVEIFQAQIDRVTTYIESHVDYFRVLSVDYNALMKNPVPLANKISLFLDGLDVDRMLPVIDHALYRNRIHVREVK